MRRFSFLGAKGVRGGAACGSNPFLKVSGVMPWSPDTEVLREFLLAEEFLPAPLAVEV